MHLPEVGFVLTIRCLILVLATTVLPATMPQTISKRRMQWNVQGKKRADCAALFKVIQRLV